MSDRTISVESIIMDNILLDINYGKYGADSKLPSDNELAEKYNVPRIKVRNVYERLESMGYIYSLQGRGRFLKRKDERIKLVLSGNESFSKKLREQGYDLKSKNLFCERIPYNKKIFDELEVDKNDEVYRIGRLRIIHDEPIAIHISYVSRSIFTKIYEDGNNIESMFYYYEINGFNNFITKESLISIVYPTLQEQKYLQCGELVPLLKLETNCLNKDDGNVLEYTEIMYRGDKFKFDLN